MSSDRTFLIAASCAGVNFLIASFLMLTLRELWKDRTAKLSWKFVPLAALFAYLATLVANTARISFALHLRRMPGELGWLDPNQLHRLEGIVIYFGFLLLLYLVREAISAKDPSRLFRLSLFPLMIYYATAIGMPLMNGAYHQGREFWEHLVWVLCVPPLLILPLALYRFSRCHRLARW
jgi:exosortase/archaeosortase family protein